MFTGIVEGLGEVTSLDLRGPGGPPAAADPPAAGDPAGDPGAAWASASAVLAIRSALVAADAAPGDSVSVSGVCLTVVQIDGDQFTADLMAETLERSALGALRAGDQVNLERAATPATRLGGHLVQGHVDGVGTILHRVSHENWDELRVSLAPELARYVVVKGSICVDGVSLTVTDVDDTSFAVGLIPTTLALTTLGHKGPGAAVNLEVDVIAKYVEKLLAVEKGQ